MQTLTESEYMCIRMCWSGIYLCGHRVCGWKVVFTFELIVYVHGQLYPQEHEKHYWLSPISIVLLFYVNKSLVHGFSG